MHSNLSASGILGTAGRVPLVDTEPLRSSDLVLAGSPLPLTAKARIYVCGITPYLVTHLGHASTFVWADALQCVARLAGVETDTCRNVTDVDDVLTAAALEHGRPYDEFALTQEFLFERDMRALGNRAPNHSPHARLHVAHVTQLAAALLATGDAYELDGFVYFRGEGIATRAGLSEQEALTLSRDFGDNPDDPHRSSPFDVPVWRPSPEDEPAWPSPWGWGRPGWHSECAAMAWATFGTSVDVIVGGEDLAFPHHAYQCAMVEAASGVTPFARREVHIGAVHKGGRKMAKSTGNMTLVGDLLAKHRAGAVRLMILNRPWHQSWEYDEREIAAAEQALDALFEAAGGTHESADAADQVVAALLDDLDVPRALSTATEAGGSAARLLLETLKLR
ncbi:MAG TPA: cysteine--tRNA ligase [Nocardioidaceae bacterium]|nr:cysteine--tRNA ligase [Nocardioidaceae bacterium]